jgi:putative spermidine/putrescine transport system substrate-binding protein
VESGNVQWDVLDGFGLEAAKEGLAEPIDYKIVDASRFVVKPSPMAVPLYAYVGGVAWDPKRSPNPPKDYAQFWDTTRFPGRRGLRNRVSEMLEMALVADGVAPDKLYPLDVERAFRSLDKIKPHVRKWFAETAQGVALIQTGEVDYTYTYLNRVLNARDSGISIDISVQQNTIGLIYFFVPKGSKNKQAAMRFLEFYSRPKRQAIQSTMMKGLAPAVKGISELLPEAVRNVLPAEGSPKNVYINGQYWGDNFIPIDRRFKEWTMM